MNRAGLPKNTLLVLALILPNLVVARITFSSKEPDLLRYNDQKSTKLYKSNQYFKPYNFDGERQMFRIKTPKKSFEKFDQSKLNNDFSYDETFRSNADNENYFDYNDDDSLIYQKSRSSLFDDSSIYYIKLPAVPYTYTPGLGYISPHPALPLSQQLHPRLAINPVIQLPFGFYSNGRPDGIYKVQNQRRRYIPNFFGLSRTTNLKGDFNFNGRPDDLFILPNQSSKSNSEKMYRRPSDFYDIDEY